MGQPVTVRLATPSDAEPIALESMAEIEHNLAWEWSPQKVVTAMKDPDTNVVVAEGEGGMLGFGIMSYKSETAHLLLFAVRADARRRGIGTSLLPAWTNWNVNSVCSTVRSEEMSRSTQSDRVGGKNAS